MTNEECANAWELDGETLCYSFYILLFLSGSYKFFRLVQEQSKGFLKRVIGIYIMMILILVTRII